MNEELQKALAEIINGALSSASAAKDFVLAELPDVVQQLLAWKMAQSLVFCLLGLLIFVAIYLGWRLVMKRWESITNEGAEPFFIVVGSAVTLFCGLGGFSLMNITWLQIWLAPKVYLLEYAASLVKQA